MTPREKAKDLLLRFSIFPYGQNETVKKCAKITVDCIKEAMLNNMPESWDAIYFWDDVIEEIKNYK